jgi:hypothetical protein
MTTREGTCIDTDTGECKSIDASSGGFCAVQQHAAAMLHHNLL